MAVGKFLDSKFFSMVMISIIIVIHIYFNDDKYIYLGVPKINFTQEGVGKHV